MNFNPVNVRFNDFSSFSFNDFPPTAQTVKNVCSVVTCAECKKPQLMFARKSLKENEEKSLKRTLTGLKFICGTSFQEFVIDTKNEEINVLGRVFVRENICCMSIVKKPYFSCNFLKKECIHCGSSKNVTTSVDSSKVQ
jgi:hypothetical protein